MNQPYGYIYLIKNLYNNKVYIGQTTNLNRRISDHFKLAFKNIKKTYFYEAIKKYGTHNFTWRILGTCNSREELNEAEKECISFFESNNKLYGYNLTNGGNQCNINNIIKEKISNANKGKLKTEEHKRKLSIANKGKKLSKETKEKISKSVKLILNNVIIKNKMSIACTGIRNGFYGKHHTEESKIKNSEAHKNKINKHTEITKEKLRARNSIHTKLVDELKIIELYKNGFTIYKICKETNYSYNLITNRLKWNNLI